MIKVQPSQSRIVKSESPDWIKLTLPREGPFSVGGVLFVLSLLWLAGCVYGFTLATSREMVIVAIVFVIPGAILLIASLALWRTTWSLERTADALLYTRRGLWGVRVKSWASSDITKLWVEETSPPRALQRYEYRCYLIVGFRNGRHEELLSGKDAEEFRWMAAMLSDPRGSRRAAEPALQLAEPVRRRSDESVVPSTLTMERSDKRVEVNLTALIGRERLWWKTLGPPAGILVLGVVVAEMMGSRSILGVFALPLAIPAAIIVGGYLYWKKTLTARLVVEDGELLIEQNYGRGLQRLVGSEIEFIQTFRAEDRSELQILLRGKPKLRLFQDRPRDELEWLARFLRVALKGRPVQASKLAVDATAGDCQVCGEKMVDRVVYCGKCRTPHHEECWSYIGTCSTYGCREIRFTRS